MTKVEVIALSISIILPLSVHAGLLSNVFANSTSTDPIPESVSLTGPSNISLLNALQNPDPVAGVGGADLIVEENALVSPGPVGDDVISSANTGAGEISVYTVRDGDSMSEIAVMFDVTVNTIIWANDLNSATDISPGDTLVILPIAGVRHVVKSGETLQSIANKYEGDKEEIISFNQLASAEDIAKGDTLIIPGGAIEESSGKAAASSGGVSTGFTHPAPGSVRTQGIHGYNGVDLAGGHGSAIRAAAAGEVIVAKAAGWNGGYGSYVVIRHSNGVQTLYAHMSSLYVGVGQWVGQGENIGGMGNTGRSTGTHLHFEVRGGRNPF